MSRQKNLKRNLLICLLAGSAVMYTLPLHAATSVVANNALPQNGQFFNGNNFIQGTANEKGNGFDFAGIGSITKPNDLTMNVHQNNQNAVIKWDSFDVGGNATVNFKGPQVEGGYNTLNYVNAGGSMSQIYGTINANNNGNIFIVNPAGVQIGNSAQINVGSLYVSNKNLDNVNWKKIDNVNPDINSIMGQGTTGDAVLMSLGNINAGEVTFEGNGRIVIDSERIKDAAGDEKLNYQNINIKTSETNKNNIIIGYEAYDETITNGSVVGYDNKNTDEVIATVTTENGTSQYKKANGYMWVEDVEQLQAIGKNANTLSGNYALRNSIDATSTANWNEVNGTYAGFNPIGLDETTGKVIVNNNNEYGFTGNFDGLDYNIFGLTINRESEANVGLFGVAHNANINNVTLVGGSITGGSVVGSVIGAALGNTHITNATNSASVTGNTDVGGIVGYSGDKLDNDGSEIKVEEGKSRFTNLINTGSVYSKGEQGTKASNAGGLIGYMYNGTLDGNSYNLGNVSGKGYNVGGLVGHAVNSVIGNPSVVDGKPVENVQVVYNRLDVSGAYNVGGIVGNMEGSTVQNAENSGTVEATGYTTEGYTYHTGVRNSGSLPSGTLNVGTVTTTVNIANAGGIAGTSSDSEIVKVTNTADVSTATETGTQYTVNDLTYYTAGNVGGIVGRAEDTNISDATNRENEMRGAHNVGGVAGYFGGTGTVSGGINDGGDIMATGARYNDNFVRELIRPGGDSNESFIIGNIGGVVGYMDGDNVYVTGSANRGTVHSQDIEEENAINVLYTSQAANVGGVVGKIDRSDTKGLVEIKNNTSLAAVNNSYNTGDVRGYTGVGGVVGMMYNGEVASSYNLGYLRTTRIATNGENIEAVNMGGIVGDTTEGSHSKGVIIYDVYNKGQIGDDTYTYYARHVAGIVGRLSGTVEKAYNNGEIYNGYTATGGIAGWMYEGSINNAFNTGNITVYNHDSSTSQVGGIVGAASVASGDINLTNVYNLGTLRSFQANSTYAKLNHNVGANSVAGIIGAVMNNRHDLIIKNAYTTGNIYAGNQDDSGNINLDKNNDMVGSIYGENRGVKNNNTGNMEYADINRTNTYYIRPENGIGFTQLGTNNYGSDNSNKGIYYNQRFNSSEYSYNNRTGSGSLSFSSQSGGDVRDNTDSNWRLYPNGTPILNAFLPNTENYFSKTENMSGISSIQYGTAYDPLLTIINAANETNNLSYNWSDLGISNAAGIAVYGAGLTLENVNTSGSSSGYYGGLIYSDGVLTINAANNEGLAFGSGADIYGSSVALNADGTITIYGDVTATGNGTAANDDPDKAGSINIASNDSDINVYGTLTSATAGESVTIPGISGAPDSNWRPVDTGDSISDPSDNLNTIGERYEHTTTASAVNGNITIEAGTWTDADKDGIQDAGEVTGGNIGLYYGNKGEGITTTGGNLTITGTGDVYVDSDLDIGGDLKLDGTGAESEVVLDITNIGEVQEKNDNTDADNSTEYLHDFLNHFANNGNIVLTSASGDAKLAVDMWDENLNNNQGAYNLNKFNYNGQTFVNKLNNLNFDVNSVSQKGDASNFTYIWVSTAEQLQGIQDYYNAHKNDSDGTGALTYNYALKNDINASDLTDYEAIGTGATDGFTGTFDGRGNRIIGLDATQTKNGNDNQVLTNAGIFSTVGDGGTVKNLNVYSGTFTGSSTAGAIAGINNGTIENITAFGNTVTVTGDSGNAGGIAGTNSGTVDDVESSGSVIAERDNAIVGGLVGTNESGATVNNSYSNSAVTSASGTNTGLGGVVGVNQGTVSLVDSLGVTNGTNSTNVGGVIGINSGTLNSAYNESIVNGNSNVGGIIGDNDGGSNYTKKEDGTVTWSKGTVENVVNATGVTGTGDYVGGLVGTNIGSVENGRNNGTITGTNYVGGMVGSNADEHSVLANLTNDSAADISGENYVGGIAGTNSGTITAQNQSNLINRGSITGQNYVGGVAGENIGTIEYVKNDVNLYVKDDTKTAQYFGGVAGINGRVDDTLTTEDETATGTITSATNEGDVVAENAQYVGGIVGWNTVNGVLDGMGNSNTGRVEGATYVGGVAGKNDADITGTADNIITIENTGVVIAHNGGAGGIFGENTGDIQYAEMSNSGIVSGTNYSGIDDVTNGTGGIIGVNSGDITYSSITNTVDGQVTGINNVGGLIGYNTGTIIGGRNEAQETDEDGNVTAEEDSYYKYKVYNNGTITVTGSGSNIGGLIGENATGGSLTAGYNTGAINAENSSNVGGIVGNNAGKVDQVFNTVMTPEGEGAITGGNNVGGLIGTNSGTLSNAYNTTEVKPTNSGVVGNAVGENSGTITNIYAANTTGHLIGSGYDKSKVTNAYSFVSNDASATEVISETADTDNDGITDRIDSDSYDGFDFTNGTWKNYDGSGNPLLKVFLTTVKVDTDDLPNLVYNTKDQDLNIDGLTGVNGAFSAVDDFTACENNNSLIQNTGFEHKNAGTYDNWLYSQQIASGSQDGTFNPNNLGYDIELTHDIDKAQITVDLNEVERTYGDTTILNNGNYNYSYDFANVTDETDLANLRNELNNNDVLSLGNVDKTKDDGGLVGDGTKTNNAGDYNWTGTVNIVDGYQGNYEFVLTTEQSNDNQSSLGTNGTSITTIGDSIVDKRQLSISDIIANIMYGNQNGSGFIITSGGTLVGVNSEEGIVYDDDVTLDTILSVTDANIVAGSSYADNKGNRVTADVGTYKDSLNLSGLQLTGDDAKNYELADTSVGGTIVVNKATITLDLSDVNRTYGNANITSGGYDVVNVNNNDVNGNNTNGDSYDANDFIVIVNNGDDGALTGNTEGRVTNDVGSYTYTGTVTSDNEKLNQNYDIVVNNSANDNNVGTGNSYVNKADLIININDVETTYGTAFDESKYGYGFGNNGANGLVNGDVLEDVKDAIDSAAGGYENTGAADSTNGKVTQDAKDGYSLSFNNELSNTNTLKNYNIITVNNGDSTVNKKQITIGANDEQILVGETPNYSGTDIDSVLVNGDSLNGNYHYGVEDSSIESVVGTHNDAIGVWIGGSFYDISNPDWSNLPGMSFFANYNVTFEPGTLTVSAYDIPEDWPHNRWDYLFNDAPFDRNKDFRERKAEVNFVDGGMEV